MFGYLRKRSFAVEQLQALTAIQIDERKAERALEDAKVLAKRRREDWEFQADYERKLQELKEKE